MYKIEVDYHKDANDKYWATITCTEHDEGKNCLIFLDGDEYRMTVKVTGTDYSSLEKRINSIIEDAKIYVNSRRIIHLKKVIFEI